MKTLIAVVAMSLAFPVFATQYSGKKFKMTISKTPDGQRVVEGEVWDTTKSEHTLVIKTVPEQAPVKPEQTKPSTSGNDPTIGTDASGRLIFK